MAQYCRHCGVLLDEGARFCRACGRSIDEPETQSLDGTIVAPPPPSQTPPPPLSPTPASPARRGDAGPWVAIGIVVLVVSVALSVWLAVWVISGKLSVSSPGATAATTSTSLSSNISSATEVTTSDGSNTLSATNSFEALNVAYSQMDELDVRVRQFASGDFNHEFFSSEVSVRQQLLTEAQSLADESVSDKDAFAAQAVSSEYEPQKQALLALYTLLVDRATALQAAAEVAVNDPSTGTGEGTVKATLVEHRSHENAQQFEHDYVNAKPVAVQQGGGD